MSTLVSSLSIDVFLLIIDLSTSRDTWQTLEHALVSPSHTRIMTLHMAFQNLKQGDDSTFVYLYRAKAYSDELTTAGRPLSLIDFNLYVFHGFPSEFKDTVTTLSARPVPVPLSELLSLLLCHEFYIMMNLPRCTSRLHLEMHLPLCLRWTLLNVHQVNQSTPLPQLVVVSKMAVKRVEPK